MKIVLNNNEVLYVDSVSQQLSFSYSSHHILNIVIDNPVDNFSYYVNLLANLNNLSIIKIYNKEDQLQDTLKGIALTNMSYNYNDSTRSLQISIELGKN